MGGAAAQGRFGVCEELPVSTTTVSFVLDVISENTKTNSYFPKMRNIKLFVSIQIVLFRKIPKKGQSIHRRVPLKIHASLDRISFAEKFLGKTWRGHNCFHFKLGLLRQNF